MKSSLLGASKPKLPVAAPPTVKKPEFQGGLAGAGTGRGGAVRGRSDMEQHFDKLRVLDKLEEGADSVGPKGLAHLCTEINIPFNELDFYILMWRLGASQSYCITRSEWMHAAYTLRIDHVGQLRTNLSHWKVSVLTDNDAFAEFYCAIFDFIRGDDEKWLPLEKALKAWSVLLPESERFKFLSLWTQWCAVEYKRPISRDIWRELLHFAAKIDDLTLYDSNEKWPTAFDDFVEWALEKKGLVQK